MARTYIWFLFFRMLGTDDSRPSDEILSNTFSPCENYSPTYFMRQSTFKTKEPFTQYPCLGSIYLTDNFKYLLVYYLFILKCLISRSISWSFIFKTRKYARTRFSNKFTINCCNDSSICVQQAFDSIVVAQSFYDLPTMYTFTVPSKHSSFYSQIRSLVVSYVSLWILNIIYLNFQILRSLKQTIEIKLRGGIEKIIEAEAYLTERENKLSNSQSNHSTSGKVPDPFSRGIKEKYF